jgi:hypothetical protein
MASLSIFFSLSLTFVAGFNETAIPFTSLSDLIVIFELFITLSKTEYKQILIRSFDGAKPRFLNRGKKRRSVSTLSIPRASDRGVEWVDFFNFYKLLATAIGYQPTDCLTDLIGYGIDIQEDEKYFSDNDFSILHWNLHNPLSIYFHFRSDDYRYQILVCS